MTRYLERLVTGRPRQDFRITSPRQTEWWQNAWLVPVSALLILLLAIALPPFLEFDPATQPTPLNQRLPGLHYHLLITHVLVGAVAIVTACLSVWPWLRSRHVAVHRWSGRVYVFSALPSAVLTPTLIALRDGWQADIGGYAQGGIWFLTTMIGYVAIRQGNYLRHRRWMMYSFAMTASVVWGPFGGLFIPPEALSYLNEVARWAGWLVNLLIVKWWLDRTDRQAARLGLPT